VRTYSYVKESELFSRRVRWLAIATGVVSALALFPVWFLLPPMFLIAGGIIQSRFTTAGRWLVWAGAAAVGPITFMYDAMLFPHSGLQPQYMAVAFSASTVLLIWCYAELVIDGVRRIRARRSTSPTAPRPVSPGAWILAVVLSLFVGWNSVRWVLAPAPSGYFHSGLFYPLTTFLVEAGVVVAFDISLIRKAAKLRRARPTI
jgi:hypothetical protein